MRRIPFLFLIFCFPLLYGGEIYSQGFLKKLKDKVEDKAVDKIINKEEKKKSDDTDTKPVTQEESGNSGTRTRRVQNTEGGGLTASTTDVKENIASAKTLFASKKYGEARLAVKQAMLGVEMEIGQNILKSLPEKADGMPKLPEEDKVTSGGIGFTGLMIQRVYATGNKELSIQIMNDAIMLSGIRMYLNNPQYANSNNDNKMKQVKFKNYPAVIQYDESSGYKLNVPFGQNSLFIVNGVNYKTEAELMKAAELFDLDKIKTELGEK